MGGPLRVAGIGRWVHWHHRCGTVLGEDVSQVALRVVVGELVRPYGHSATRSCSSWCCCACCTCACVCACIYTRACTCTCPCVCNKRGDMQQRASCSVIAALLHKAPDATHGWCALLRKRIQTDSGRRVWKPALLPGGAGVSISAVVGSWFWFWFRTCAGIAPHLLRRCFVRALRVKQRDVRCQEFSRIVGSAADDHTIDVDWAHLPTEVLLCRAV
jgi:hypothetical protein